MANNTQSLNWKVIPISAIEGVRFGQVQRMDGMTGVSVALLEKNNAGVDISGGGPASREAHLLSPLTDDKSMNAVVFSGGSAYGLAASDGVMRYLEEHHVGYAVGKVVVPLVVQSCIFDLNIGHAKIRPDADMGYAACVAAEQAAEPLSGSVGAGTGATVGKLCGMPQSQKAGVGYFAVEVGDLQIGAMVVVNAVGDVFDYQTGKKVAGVVTPDRRNFLPTDDLMIQAQQALTNGANTTLAAIFTNAKFSAPEMNRIAVMARTGLARSVRPVNTMADGDAIYTFSLGEVVADVNMVGALAANVLSEAILKALAHTTISETDYLQLIE